MKRLMGWPLAVIAVLGTAMIFGGILLSNKGGVILNHKHVLSVPSTHKIEVEGLIFKDYTIHLGTTIGKPEDFKYVRTVLNNASRTDTVTVYFSGYGGRVDSLVQLVNAVKNSKATTVAIVEGSVYSAHATLPMAFDELIVRDNVVFMFHHSSAYDPTSDRCAGNKGQTDRGTDKYKKCQDFYKYHLATTQGLMTDLFLPVLTYSELEQVFTGYDVYVPGKTIQMRWNVSKKHQAEYEIAKLKEQMGTYQVIGFSSVAVLLLVLLMVVRRRRKQ